LNHWNACHVSDIYVDKTVAALQELHRDVLQTDRAQITIPELLERQAKNILQGHADGNIAVAFHLGSWCTGMIGKTPSEMLDAELTLQQAQQTIAAEYGFSNWAEVEALGKQAFDITFENAVDLVITGELTGLLTQLKLHPELAQQKSQFPHNATLLHYIAANGVESHRQITPLNAVEIAACLIEAGADVNAEANIYGGSATLGLLVTSAHPYNAGVVDPVAELLRCSGAHG